MSTDTVPFDLDALVATMSPAQQRNMARYRRVVRFQFELYKVCPWMRHPFLQLVQAVWVGPLEEGFLNTFKPRWGAITFGWLNDGFRPTVWLTVLGLFVKTDLYPNGAPTFRQWLRNRHG